MGVFMSERSPEIPTNPQSPRLAEGAKLAAQAAAGSAVKHIKSVMVTESAGSGMTWEGRIEVFEVLHPPPGFVYVWPVDAGNGPEYVAILGVYPVDSPLGAVRTWLATKKREGVLNGE
jgi:hypothetical protein